MLCLACPKCRAEHAELLCGPHQPLRGAYFWFLAPFNAQELARQFSTLDGLLKEGLAADAAAVAAARASKKAAAAVSNVHALRDDVHGSNVCHRDSQHDKDKDSGDDDDDEVCDGTSSGPLVLVPSCTKESELSAPVVKSAPWAAGSANRRRTLRRQMERITARLDELVRGACGGDQQSCSEAARRCRRCERILVAEWQVSPTACSEATSAVETCDGRCWGFLQNLEPSVGADLPTSKRAKNSTKHKGFE